MARRVRNFRPGNETTQNDSQIETLRRERRRRRTESGSTDFAENAGNKTAGEQAKPPRSPRILSKATRHRGPKESSRTTPNFQTPENGSSRRKQAARRLPRDTPARQRPTSRLPD